MKQWHLLFLCLLTTAFYLFSHNMSSCSSASPSNFFLTVRRSMRELRMSPLHRRIGNKKTKVLDEEREQTIIQKNSRQLESLSSDDHFDDLAYHIDYHGVTTHPTPTPRHPRP